MEGGERRERDGGYRAEGGSWREREGGWRVKDEERWVDIEGREM